MDDDLYDMTTLEAVADLLAQAQSLGYGIIFEPDDLGWRVSWIQNGQGGPLVQANTLRAAVNDAFLPLTNTAAERA